MKFQIRSILLKLVALFRSRSYARLFLIVRVVPQLLLVAASLLFIHKVELTRTELKVAASSIHSSGESDDINFNRARSIARVTFRSVDYFPSLAEDPIHFSTFGLIKANVAGTGLLLGCIILLSLIVVLGNAYYSAYVTLDTFGESEDKSWPQSHIHRITRESNMWIMLVAPALVLALSLCSMLFAGTGAVAVYILLAIVFVAGLLAAYRLVFTLISRLLDANSIIEGARRSWGITQGKFWQVVVVTLVFGLPSLVTFALLLAAGVGDVPMVRNPGALFTTLVYTIPGGLDIDVWMLLALALVGDLIVAAIFPVMLTLFYLDLARNDMWQEWLGEDATTPLDAPLP